MKFIVKTNSGMGDFEFTANTKEEFEKEVSKAKRITQLNRYWYKYNYRVEDENGRIVCYW